MLVATRSPRLVRRFGPRALMVTGLLLLAVDLALLARAPVRGTYLVDLLPGFLLTSGGLGLTFVTATIAVTGGVAAEEQGLASGLLNTAQQVGFGLGLAVLVSIAVARTASLGGPGPVRAAPGPVVAGYDAAFGAAALLAVVGALIALAVIRPASPDSTRSQRNRS